MPYYQFTGPDGPHGSFETFFNHPDPQAPAIGSMLASKEPGWFWWSCFPGCLPDGDMVGPFVSEQAAIEDAQDGAVS